MNRTLRSLVSAIRPILVILLALSFSGCYLQVITTNGGQVQSASTYRDCNSGQTCEFLVGTSAFSETFTAIPNEGYEFKGWQTGGAFLCGASHTNTCVVTVYPNSDPLLMGIVRSEKNAYIMPLFESTAAIRQTVDILDGDGNSAGDFIGGETSQYLNFQATFSEGIGNVRFYPAFAHVQDIDGPGWVYLIGDECNVDAAYTSGPTFASTVGPFGDGNNFFRADYYPQEEVYVGSLMNRNDEACYDIPDQYLTLTSLTWLGVDNFVYPLTRVGPPSCLVMNVPGCVY